MKKYLEYTLLIYLTILLAGCIADDFKAEGSGNVTGEETDVKVTLQMPSASGPNTYAISAIDENVVEAIDVLVFRANILKPSGWEFAYCAEGTAIADQSSDNPTKSKKQFTVKLIKNPNLQTMVILANVRAQVEALGEIGVGADKKELLSRLVFENAGSWNANNDNSKQEGDSDRFQPFPMWGEVTAMVNDATTQITGVSLIRSIVRMDVLLADAVTNFKLDEVYIYNSKDRGQVVPDPNNMDGANKVKAATIPSSTINNATPLKYTVPVTMERLFERTIYLFEAQGTTSDFSSEATCIVVGGTFGTDSEPSYYRLDFFKKDASDNYTKDYRDILRNHRYRTHIISVSGRGYPTPDDAFNSKAVNMQAEVKVWDDGQMSDIIFDGQYLLAVSHSAIELPMEAKTFNKLLVTTDYPTGWKAEIIAGESWFSLPSNTTGAAHATTALPFKVANNTGGQPRTGYIKITAGRLSYIVTIKQIEKPAAYITATPNLLEFSNYNIQEKKTALTWGPVDKTCLLNVVPQANRGVFFTTPLPPATPVGGSYGLPVKPDPMPTDETAKNPFLVKESILNLSVTNDEGVTATQVVTIRQTNYAVVPIAEEFYQMDGKTYTFKVKSNANWNVTEVSDPKNVCTLQTSSGVANTATGTNVSIKFVNDMANNGVIGSGVVTLRFSSPDGLFPDTDLIIRGISGYIIRAKDVPKTGEETGLDNDLLVQMHDLSVRTNWYNYNNVPGNQFSLLNPPLGPQYTTPLTSSCAGSLVGGLTDWRMPSLREQLAIFTYLRHIGGNYNFINYNYKDDEYFTATQDGEASGNYALAAHPRSSHSLHGETVYYYFHTKGSTSEYARCVRTLK